MKDSASKQGKSLLLVALIISLGACFPLWIGVTYFIKASTDELINSWYQSEIANIQQGNVLSSITKLQRSIEKSVVLKAVKVVDVSNREVIAFSRNNENFTWPQLEKIPTHKELSVEDLNVYQRVYSFGNGKVKVYILTGSLLSIFLLSGITIYILSILIVLVIIVRRSTIVLERLKADSELKNASLQLEVSEKLASMAEQVSHDIRSPIAALNSIVSSLEEVPVEKRTLIRNATVRINDIANNLLSSSRKGIQNYDVNSSRELLISSLLDEIVSEKRIEFKDRANINITLDLEESFGIFGKINPVELKSCISNFITNSIEARLGDNQLDIVIKLLMANESFFQIKISDNGKGIPPELLPLLGSKGVTYGKKNSESGSGLGVYQAKKYIESAGGELTIESEFNTGKGSTFSIFLPRSSTPSWFCQSVVLEANQIIASLDDDQSIGNLWKNRFEKFSRLTKHEFDFNYFSNVDEFLKFIEENLSRVGLALVDYEFSDYQTGLEVLEKLSILSDTMKAKTFLVTSHSENSKIQAKCIELETKIIPKSLIPQIPLKLNSELIVIPDWDVVLIDDDKLIRLSWIMKGKELNKKIITFDTLDAFFKLSTQINKDAFIYLDSSLGFDSEGNGIRGEDYVELIFKLGFSNIYMMTGFSSDNFQNVRHLKGVVGKTPSFS